MIPRDTIDRIFSAAHIEDVVASYISLKKRGANLIGLCPFHEEKTGSFTVSPSKGIYKCFGCGKSGHVANFIMDIEQCSYVEALKILAKRYGIQIEERELTPEEHQQQDDRESMFVVNDWANKWFQQQLWETEEGKAVGLSYLRERGLRDDIIHKFNIGYSPDKSLLSAEAKKQGFKEKYLVNDSQNAPYIGTGVCLKSEDGRLYDRFHSRVIFPFFSPAGKVIGFAGRLLKQNDKVGKYVNSPTSPLFEKHDCLYGLYQAKQSIVRLNRCYLVEGQMDVISMFQSGIENVVASGGTSLTKPQIRLMHRFTENITVLYDGDKAGIKAALRGIDMILEEGISVKVLLLPDGEDPDSFARTHTAEEFTNYISLHQTDFIRFKIQLLSEDVGQDPIARRELIKSVVQSISVIPDRITRAVYLKDSASLLDMQEDILKREVDSLRIKRFKKDHPEDASPEGEEKPQPQEESTPKPTTQVSPQAVTNDIFNENMLNLLRVIVRNGEQELFTDNGQSICVGEYIIGELNNDGILPRQIVHQQILTDFMAHYHDEGFVAESYFLHHENAQISHLAVELVVDRYQLSKMYAHQASEGEKLDEVVTRLLLEMKYTVVNERINMLQSNLEKAQKEEDWEAIRTLLAEQPLLLDMRAQVCRALGNRVITI
ncbi:MAG: DNA primase [Paludibacteraceae bacterium]|nr:DNA primase [Paludibacteraceae bacterium]